MQFIPAGVKARPARTVARFALLVLLCGASGVLQAQDTPPVTKAAETPQSNETASLASGHSRISYQGYAESGGVPVTGGLTVTFRIFTAASGGSHLWEETQNVTLEEGVFSAELGASTALTLPFDQPYWLAFKLGGDPWMTDRSKLLTAPYAFTTGALQGNPVLATSPSTDQVLAWNGTSWSSRFVTGLGYWKPSGSNIYLPTGRVGIGDSSPAATLTVGSGDKLQIHGSDGDIVFKDDQGTMRFANSAGSNAAMIEMFPSGTSNSTRMLVAHSPSFSNWGIAYNDTADAFTFTGSDEPALHVDIGNNPKVGVATASPQYLLQVGASGTDGNGAHVTNGGAWTNGSSRAFKEHLRPVGSADVLKSVLDLPIYRWQYKDSDEGEHMGPVAEDFFDAFGLGADERYISGVDGDGVALAAIQGLYEIVQMQQSQIEQLQTEIERLSRE